jgi:hypothetical protein
VAGLTATSGIVGSNVYTLPVLTGTLPRLGGPSNVLVGIYRNDYAMGATFSLTHYGAARTFAHIGSSNYKQHLSMTGVNGGGNTEYSFAVRTT